MTTIVEANELNEVGGPRWCAQDLDEAPREDLRCLDAHAHLGNFAFDHRPASAQRLYEIGKSIGAFFLGKEFDGVLPWGHIDNRLFLRCLHGVGLCAWHCGDRRATAAVFKRMLWLQPQRQPGRPLQPH